MISKAQLASSARLNALIWFLVLAWICVLSVQDVPLPSGFVKPVSSIILLLTLTSFAFNHWAWRWKWVNWIAQRPDLVGTWKGTLKSSYVNPNTGEPTPPIEVFLTIHQTYKYLQLRLLTPESCSTTLAASLGQESDGRYNIWAVYRNEPKLEFREHSPIHRGGLHLHVGGQAHSRLEGEFWTDRRTFGSLELTPVSKTEASDYKTARELAERAQTDSSHK